MAVTVSVERQVCVNGMVMTIGTMAMGTLGSSGEVAITPNEVKLGAIDDIIIDSIGGVVFQYDKANAQIVGWYTDSSDVSAVAPLVVANAAAPGTARFTAMGPY